MAQAPKPTWVMRRPLVPSGRLSRLIVQTPSFRRSCGRWVEYAGSMPQGSFGILDVAENVSSNFHHRGAEGAEVFWVEIDGRLCSGRRSAGAPARGGDRLGSKPRLRSAAFLCGSAALRL